MVVHICVPSTWEVEEVVPGDPGLQSGFEEASVDGEFLPQTKTKQKIKKPTTKQQRDLAFMCSCMF